MADIPINEVTRRVQFTGNTGTGPFAFTFNILADDDLVVYKNFVLQTITTDYTVSTNANGTGSITLTSALIASDVLTIIGGRALERTTDFVTAGDLLASSLNEQFDSLVIMAQQLDEKLDRSLKVDIGDQFTDLSLPGKADRVGKVMAFNATSGDPEAGPTIGDVSSIADITADITLLADIEDGTTATNAITNVNTIRTDVSTVSGVSANVTTVAGISANVTTVAGISANVTTVAGVSSEVATLGPIASDITTVSSNNTNVTTVASNINAVNTVASNIANVNTVANDLLEVVSEIETVANDLNEATSEIEVVANNIANVNTVGTISGNVTTVAGISADVTAVAADASDIGTVATNISNVNTVAGISANVTTVAGISANVTTVAGISANVTTVAGDTANIGTIATNLNGTDTIGTVAGSISNVNSVGGSITNVNTVATNLTSINSFANTYRIGTTDPTTSLDTGDLFFNTTSGTLKVYTGSAWEAGVTAGSGFLPLSGGTLTGGLTGTSGTFSGDLTVDTNTLYVDSTNNRVGIGTSSPSSPSHVLSTSIPQAKFAYDADRYVALTHSSIFNVSGVGQVNNLQIAARGQGGGNEITFLTGGTDASGTGESERMRVKSDGNLQINSQLHFTDSGSRIVRPTANSLSFDTNNTERMRIDSSGNVGIGVSDPSTWSLGKALHIGVKENNLWGEGDYAFHMMQNAYYNSGWKYTHTDQATRYSQEDGQHLWHYAASGTADTALTWSEAMRIDSSGNLLVGKTSTSTTVAGIVLNDDGRLFATGEGGSGHQAARFTRLSNDGDIVNFYKDSTEVGSIYNGGGNLGINSSGGLLLVDDIITPTSGNDATYDIGRSLARYKDLYLSGGVVENTTTVSYAASIALTYDNGSIQTVTLTGNVTFTDSIADGESIVLMLNAGASYTVTFPTMTWVSSGGNAAPTLTANDTLVFWKIGSTLYGAYAGSYT